MKFNFLKVLLPVAVAFALPSCLGSDSSVDVYESNLAQCLTYGQNVNTYAQNFNKMSFVAEFDNNSKVLNLSIVGMVLPEAGSTSGISIPRMELKGLPWSYNKQGWKSVKVENVTPVITGMSVVPDLKKVQFDIAEVFDQNGNYRPGIQYRLKVEYLGSEYELVGCCMTGTTVATDPEGVSYSPESDQAVKTKPAYWVDFDYLNSRADIYLYGAKFLGSMPSLNLMFPAVPYTIEDGKIVLKSAGFNPMFGGVANPAFPITDLKGTIDYATSSMVLDFNCNFRGADYKVKIDCKY